MKKDELTAARKELGMTKADLAKRLRTPYRTYVNWERGERPIPGACETAIELLLRFDRMRMQAINELVARRVGGGVPQPYAMDPSRRTLQEWPAADRSAGRRSPSPHKP